MLTILAGVARRPGKNRTAGLGGFGATGEALRRVLRKPARSAIACGVSAETLPHAAAGALVTTQLKERPGNELQVYGSGLLAHTLIDHDLIDECRLLLLRHGLRA